MSPEESRLERFFQAVALDGVKRVESRTAPRVLELQSRIPQCTHSPTCLFWMEKKKGGGAEEVLRHHLELAGRVAPQLCQVFMPAG